MSATLHEDSSTSFPPTENRHKSDFEQNDSRLLELPAGLMITRMCNSVTGRLLDLLCSIYTFHQIFNTNLQFIVTEALYCKNVKCNYRDILLLAMVSY